MSTKHVSRRSFLRRTAASSTGAALAGLPAAAAPGTPPWPVTVESFPLDQPGPTPTNARINVVISGDSFPDAFLEKLHSYAPNIEIKVCSNANDFRRELPTAHVIYGSVSREDFASARELRWIQYGAAGVEEILCPELVTSPVVLTNMQRMYSPTISETVIGLLIALTRRLNDYSLQTHDARWNALPGLREISGMTMGLVGMGGIGSDTAYRAHYGFHMRILATDAKPIPKPIYVAELHSPEWLLEMVPQVDVLASAAPHTPLTRHLFNDDVFRRMKPSAYFINVSRGWLVDQPALARALKENRIAGAALDATEPEPLPADDPLWTAGNILITSHTSARSPQTDERVRNLFCENLRRYVNGLPLLNVVDKERGY
jgi:phosphoglycerate dehydrogenase-like enzyme